MLLRFTLPPFIFGRLDTPQTVKKLTLGSKITVLSAMARGLNSLGFSRQCFVRPDRRNNCLVSRNHFPFWRRCPETAEGYQVTNKTAVTPARNRRLPMRTTSLILAFAFILAGPSMAGSSEDLPGVGTFAYNGSPLASPETQPRLVAAR